MITTKITRVSDLHPGDRFFVGTPKLLDEMEDLGRGAMPGQYAVRDVKIVHDSAEMMYPAGDALVWCHDEKLSTGFLPYAWDDLVEVIVEDAREELACRALRVSDELEAMLDAIYTEDIPHASIADICKMTSYAFHLIRQRQALAGNPQYRRRHQRTHLRLVS